ncbi:MAG: hypothetical protein AB1898_15205 [Acidobacteriota bacterium]
MASDPAQATGDYTDPQEKIQRLCPYAKHPGVLVILGSVSTLVHLSIRSLEPLRQSVPEFVALLLSCAVVYLAACWVALRFGPANLKVILGFAILFRILWYPGVPSLSDDIYRYLWEGFLHTKGINPYEFAPQAPELMPLRNEVWQFVNNKDQAAIYPPFMQMLNAGTYVLSGSLWGFKAMGLFFEALAMLAIHRLLRKQSMDPARLIVYAWNPLVVVEIAGNGHNDPVAVALLLWAIVLMATTKTSGALLSLGCSVLSKAYPAVMIPLFLKRVRSLWPWLWLPGLLIAGYLPYRSAGDRVFASLMSYREKWRFNGFLFHVLSNQFGSDKVAETIGVTIFFSVLLICLFRKESLLRDVYWLTGAVLLVSPTLFPWYLVWILPFLCFFPSPAWLFLTLVSPLSYYVVIEWWIAGVWRQNPLFLWLQYLPFYLILLLESLQRVRRWGPLRSD